MANLRAVASRLWRAFQYLWLIGLILAVPGPSVAALVDKGNFTLDTTTGLAWLDVTETANLSYNDILAGAGGWSALGWRHATAAEICDLFGREAIDPNFLVCPTETLQIFTGPDNVSFIQLATMNLLGTFFFQLSPQTQATLTTEGWFDDESATTAGRAFLRKVSGGGFPPFDQYTASKNAVSRNDVHQSIGNFLVRIPVPPVPGFSFSEHEEYMISQFDADDGTNLIGKRVVINTNLSNDPDGTIVQKKITIQGRYSGSVAQPLMPGANGMLTLYLPREDYSITLEVTDDDGQKATVTSAIPITLADCLYSSDSASSTPIVASGFLDLLGGGNIDLVVIRYKFDGEYYFYLTSIGAIRFPGTAELAYHIPLGSQHEIGASPPPFVPANSIAVGHAKFDVPNRTVFEASGFGLCIVPIFELEFIPGATIAPIIRLLLDD